MNMVLEKRKLFDSNCDELRLSKYDVDEEYNGEDGSNRDLDLHESLSEILKREYVTCDESHRNMEGSGDFGEVST